MPTAVCSGCSKAHRVAENSAGKRSKCKNCAGVIAVPMPAAAPVTTVPRPKKALVPPPLPVAPTYEDTDRGGDADLDAVASLETSGVVLCGSIVLFRPVS